MTEEIVIRKKNRLEHYDYSQEGYYFVTICTKNRENIFGTINEGKNNMNEFGKIAESNLTKTTKIYDGVKLDYYVIMPNHIHAIIEINKNVDRPLAGDNVEKSQQYLFRIIGSYKSAVSREIHEILNYKEFEWQKSFYDQVIRNEKQLYAIREYITNNPLAWEYDEENLQREKERK